MRTLAALTAAAVCFALSATAFAQGVPNFYTARAVSLGGARSLATGVDSIFLNPAALGISQQYLLQADYAHDTAPNPELTTGDGVVVSIVDAATNPRFPTGVSYRYVSLKVNGQLQRGSVYDFALAAQLFQNMYLGLHLSYLSFTNGSLNVQNITGDFGLLIPVGPFTFSGTAFNLLTVQSPDAPRGGDVGIAVTDNQMYRVGFDYSRLWPINRFPENVYSAGGEVVFYNMVPVRAGVLWNSHDPKGWPPEYVTAGLGFYFQMIGVDASYRRNLLNGEGSWAFSVKLLGGGQ